MVTLFQAYALENSQQSGAEIGFGAPDAEGRNFDGVRFRVKIVFSVLQEDRSNRKRTFRPDILYRYNANGQRFTSSQVDYLQEASSKPQLKILVRLPADSEAVCFVNPRNRMVTDSFGLHCDRIVRQTAQKSLLQKDHIVDWEFKVRLNSGACRGFEKASIQSKFCN